MKQDMQIENYWNELKTKKVAVIGAGVSNLPLLQLLKKHGIQATVYDRKNATELGAIYQQLQEIGVPCVLGTQYLEQIDADVVFRTPGLHPKYLENIKQNGAEITSEMELFFRFCPCPIIGITGSDGKTTTTTLVYEILKQAGYHCFLGGNIGMPLLPHIHEINQGDIAVVELSSFQLMDMHYSPFIAAITNITPNHLDYHPNLEEYVQAKTNIFQHMKKDAKIIYNEDDLISTQLSFPQDIEKRSISMLHPVKNGFYKQNEWMYQSQNNTQKAIMKVSDIAIPGIHNIYNMMMAFAICKDFCDMDDCVQVAKSFQGVTHRIEFVDRIDGVSYYNDSIASSPTRTIAGLRSFSKKMILIAGGYDKKIPYDVLGLPICEHTKAVILTGDTAQKIRKAIENTQCDMKPDIFFVADLEEAVACARNIATEGDIVVMSPASASFDRYRNFEERGNHFKQLVNSLKD